MILVIFTQKHQPDHFSSGRVIALMGGGRSNASLVARYVNCYSHTPIHCVLLISWKRTAIYKVMAHATMVHRNDAYIYIMAHRNVISGKDKVRTIALY